tara:strand:- start:346 stop:1110 length:765 start_codon:yes stop_codon:yes gene_type:complete
MPYCSIEEAWGESFNNTNTNTDLNTNDNSNTSIQAPKRKCRKNKRKRIKNLGMYDSEMNEMVEMSGKYSDKNKYSRDIHSNLTRTPRINPIEVDIVDNNVRYINPSDPQYQMINYEFRNQNQIQNQNQNSYLDLEQNSSYDDQFYPNGSVVQYQNNGQLEPVSNFNNNTEQNIVELDTQEESDLVVHQHPEVNNKFRELERKIDMILEKVLLLEDQLSGSTTRENIHDIILFIIFGLFVIFVMNSVYKIGKRAI